MALMEDMHACQLMPGHLGGKFDCCIHADCIYIIMHAIVISYNLIVS